jgi:hypothetical protein
MASTEKPIYPWMETPPAITIEPVRKLEQAEEDGAWKTLKKSGAS